MRRSNISVVFWDTVYIADTPYILSSKWLIFGADHIQDSRLSAIVVWIIATSNVTGRHRGPKRKLRAGHRAPLLQHTSYLWVGLLCEASSISHRQVWYRALSLCYAHIRRSGIILSPNYLVPNFVSVAPSIAELARGEKSRTQSLSRLHTQSINQSIAQLIWYAGNRNSIFP